MMHPHKVSAQSPVLKIAHGLPLKEVPATQPAEELTCQTCHNPHASAKKPSLLRVKDDAPARALCITCHPGAQYIESSMHSREFLDPDNKDPRACSPCHAPHATTDTLRDYNWSAPVLVSGKTFSEKLCLGCHDGKQAKHPTVIQHPATAMQKIQAAATTRPSEMQKKLAMIKEITCSTCHLPHGRQLNLETGAMTQPAAKTLLSAIKPMLRPDVDRNLCATCHGIDATRVYLYFHDPKKREAVQKLVNP
jgi:predicted CXXCH cytochrome family protein